MNQTILRKTVPRNASFALLTLAFCVVYGCSGPADKDPTSRTRKGWDLLPEIVGVILSAGDFIIAFGSAGAAMNLKLGIKEIV